MVRQSFQALPGERGEARGQQDHEQKNPSPKLRFFALQILRRAGTPSGRGLGHGGSHRVRVRGTTKPSVTETIVLILTRQNNRCCWRIWYFGVDFGTKPAANAEFPRGGSEGVLGICEFSSLSQKHL